MSVRSPPEVENRLLRLLRLRVVLVRLSRLDIDVEGTSGESRLAVRASMLNSLASSSRRANARMGESVGSNMCHLILISFWDSRNDCRFPHVRPEDNPEAFGPEGYPPQSFPQRHSNGPRPMGQYHNSRSIHGQRSFGSREVGDDIDERRPACLLQLPRNPIPLAP